MLTGPASSQNLKRAGVDTSAMEQVAGLVRSRADVRCRRWTNAIVVVPGANGKMDRAAVDDHADLIRSAGMVLCQLEIPMDTLSYTLDFCARAGVPVMLDPAPAADLPAAVWNQVAWFTPNETEAAHYVGDGADAESSAKRLLEKGLRGVVLKRGAKAPMSPSRAAKRDG